MSTSPQSTSPHHSPVSSTHTLHVHITSVYFTSSLSSLLYSHSTCPHHLSLLHLITLQSPLLPLYMSTSPQSTSPLHSPVSSTPTLHVHITSVYFTSSLSSLHSTSKCYTDCLSRGNGPHIHLTILISTISILVSWSGLMAIQ